MSDQVFIPLGRIRPNPYQQRRTEDPVAVQDIALSIYRNISNGSKGLLQVPSAREIPGGCFELVFGHTRFAAFELLRRTGIPSEGIEPDDTFEEMPLHIVQLTDQQMFEQATIENVKRRDLNPVEVADALQRYMHEFGVTSKQAGELFGMNEATVRGKVRLLDLPKAAQEKLAAGAISEGTARTLLSVQKAATEKQVEKIVSEIERRGDRSLPDEVIASSLEHMSNVAELFDESRESGNAKPRAGRSGWLLDMKNFPNELLPELSQEDLALALGIEKDEKLLAEIREQEEIHGDLPTSVALAATKLKRKDADELKARTEQLLKPPACTACPFYTRIQGTHYCGLKLCYARKAEAWGQQQLVSASKSLGIAVYDKADGAYQVLESAYYSGSSIKLFNAKDPGLRLIAKRDLKSNSYQSGYKGVPEDSVVVIAVGSALETLKRPTRSDGRPGMSEADKLKQKRERIFRMRRKPIVWEFTSVGKQLFGSMAHDVLDKFTHWHFVGVNDGVPQEFWPSSKAAAAIKLDYLRRELVWNMVESENLINHFRIQSSLAELVKQLVKLAAEWDAKMSPSLLASLERLAKEGDAEIAAVKAAPKKTVSTETAKKNGKLVRQLQGALHPAKKTSKAPNGRKAKAKK